METWQQQSQKKLVGPCIICEAEGSETKFRRFTEDAKYKAIQHETLDPTWELNISQFCHKHYMSYIVNGNVRSSDNASNSKKQHESDRIPERIGSDDAGKPELIMEDVNSTSKVSGEKGVSEIFFIDSVKSMARILYAREKKEKQLLIYDWKLLQADMESKDNSLTAFFDMLEKLINPSNRGLVDHTISQRQKGLSFLCHFLAGIGNKQISAMKKDIAMFLDQSRTSDRAINILANMQLSSTSRENRRKKISYLLVTEMMSLKSF